LKNQAVENKKEEKVVEEVEEIIEKEPRAENNGPPIPTI
jgi:hypothetical protein